jgi:hypothetical protein
LPKLLKAPKSGYYRMRRSIMKTTATLIGTVAVVGAGLHNGLPVNFTMISVNHGDVAPGVFQITCPTVTSSREAWWAAVSTFGKERLDMKKLIPLVFAMALLITLLGLSAQASPPPGPYFNGFEHNTTWLV